MSAAIPEGKEGTMKRASRILTMPLRLLLGLSKVTLVTMMLLFMLGSVALPIITTLSATMFSLAVSTASFFTNGIDLVSQQKKEREFVELLLENERSARKKLEIEAKSLKARLQMAETGLPARKISYRGGSRTVKEALLDTQDRITTRTAKRLGREVVGMAGEAIPYVGVAATVGLMGADVYDSCEMLKELDAFARAVDPSIASNQDEVCGIMVPDAESTFAAAKAAAASIVPDFYWAEGWQDLRSNLPEFYWKEGWSDLVGQTDSTP